MNDFDPPLYDTDAEKAALGAMMRSPLIADQLMEQLTAGDFLQPRHSAIFGAIVGSLSAGLPADPLSLTHYLAARDDLVRSGGAPYLHEVVNACPVPAHGPHFARIVADFAARRRVQETAIRLGQMATDMTRDVPEMIEAAQSAVHHATVTRDGSSATYGQLLDDTIAEICNPTGRQRGLSTGLGILDDVIGGLKPGQLIIVGARPGCGKSVLLAGMCRQAAMHTGVPAALFSLEMSPRELMHRLLSSVCNIDLGRITHGNLQVHEQDQLRAAANHVRSAPLHIDATKPLDLPTLRSRARKIQQRHGLDLIAVDYLQLMTSGTSRSRVEEVAEISRGLKLLAGDLGVPVVAAAQVNRQAEQRSDRRPQLSDLRESGSIEADADVVILLHRDDLTQPEHIRAGEIDLIVAKNRNGPQETVTAAAQLHKSRIVDMVRG